MPGWQISCNFIVTYIAGGVNGYRKTPDADASGVKSIDYSYLILRPIRFAFSAYDENERIKT